MEELRKHFAAILKHCAAQGFVLPLYIAAVSRNGTALFWRVEKDGDNVVFVVLCKHEEQVVVDGVATPFFVLPANMMVTDGTGEKAIGEETERNRETGSASSMEEEVVLGIATVQTKT